MRIYVERIGYNGNIILVEKTQKNYICEDDIHHQIGRWMQDRTDAGQIRCRTGQMQDRSDSGQVRCRTGQMQDRSYAAAGWKQDRSDEVQIRYRTRRIQG